MKFSKSQGIVLLGMVWLAIGGLLLYKGIFFIVDSVFDSSPSPIMKWLAAGLGTKEQAGFFLLANGLALGYVKTRWVLQKVVVRNAKRLSEYKSTLSFKQLYTMKDIIFIFSMMLLGMGMSAFSPPHEVRGLIDVTVGSALIHGAFLYFRAAFVARRKTAS